MSIEAAGTPTMQNLTQSMMGVGCFETRYLVCFFICSTGALTLT
jgi:hypothetical protein